MPQKRKDLKIEGANLWYLVGLITSDGCLCSDGRHIDITSKDRSFLETLVEKLRIPNKVCVKGRLHSQSATQFRLKYGKMAAREIIKRCYYDGCLGLQRKIDLARNCLNSPRGWGKSHTVNF